MGVQLRELAPFTQIDEVEIAHLTLIVVVEYFITHEVASQVYIK